MAPLHIPVTRQVPPLLPHQRQGVSYLRARADKGLGGLLFMEMRTGKTMTLIRFLTDAFPLGVHLILAPKTVLYTWHNELYRLGHRNISVLLGEKEERINMIANNDNWFLLNYEMAESLNILSYKFDTVTCDESIRITNPKAKITNYLLKNSHLVPFRYVLCGNAAPEHQMQYACQFMFVQGDYFGYRNYWQVRNNLYVQNGYEWFPAPLTTKKVYNYVHENAYVVSRKDVNLGGKKIYTTRYVEMTDAQRKAYDSMLRDFEYNGISTNLHIVQAGYLAQIASGYDFTTNTWFSEKKIDEILYLLKTELSGQQVLIWTRFVHEAEKIADTLKIPVITGDIRPDVRESIRQEFHKGKFQAIAATIKSMKVGTDWSCASTSIYASNEFSNDDRTQSEDRIIHPQKKEDRLIIDLCTRKTVDEHVSKALIEKRVSSDFFMSKLFGNIMKDREEMNAK